MRRLDGEVGEAAGEGLDLSHDLVAHVLAHGLQVVVAAVVYGEAEGYDLLGPGFLVSWTAYSLSTPRRCSPGPGAVRH